MVSPGGATTYPVRFKLEVDDSALRQAVVNSRAFIETNVARRTAGDMQMSMGQRMVSDYTEGMRQRAFSPVNQMMQGLFSGVADSAPGGASWTNRTNMMMGTLNMQLGRVFQPGSIMPQPGFLANLALGDTFSPNQGAGAFGARQEAMRALAGMPTTGFSGDQSASGLMNAANRLNFDYNYQSRFVHGTLAEMNRMGTMNNVMGRTGAMDMFDSMKRVQPMAMAMGLDPTQTATMMNNLVNFGVRPGSLSSAVEGLMFAKTSGADMGQLAQQLAEGSARNVGLQRFGATGLMQTAGQIERNSALSAQATQLLGTLTDKAGNQFIVNQQVRSEFSDQFQKVSQTDPSMTDDAKMMTTLRMSGFYNQMREEDKSGFMNRLSTSMAFTQQQNKIDVRNNESQQRLMEAFTPGAAARALFFGTGQVENKSAGAPLGTSQLGLNVLAGSSAMESMKMDQGVVDARQYVAANPGGLDFDTARENPGLVMDKAREGLLGGFAAGGAAYRAIPGFFSGLAAGAGAFLGSELTSIAGTSEQRKQLKVVGEYDKRQQAELGKLSKNLTGTISGALGAGGMQRAGDFDADTALAASVLLSRGMDPRTTKDMMKKFETQAGPAAVKLYGELQGLDEAAKTKVVTAGGQLNKAASQAFAQKNLPVVLGAMESKIVNEHRDNTAFGKALMKDAVQGEVVNRSQLMKNWTEMQKNPEMKAEGMAMIKQLSRPDSGVQFQGVDLTGASEGTAAGGDSGLLGKAAKSLREAADNLSQLSGNAKNPNRAGR